MSKVSEAIRQTLREIELAGDGESYHRAFDDFLEKKLMELDPEWMKQMNKIYDKSEMSKWYA